MQIVHVQVKTQLAWLYTIDPNGDYTAVCKPLAIAVSGSSLEEMVGSMQDALDLLIVDLIQRNELQRFLRLHGWTMPMPVEEITTQSRDLRFEIPLNITADKRGPEAALCS